MDISFIIPIYNTSKEKMKRCFDSVNKINNLKYEALLIDDGSDSFVNIFCMEYIKTHPEFCYYYQSHAGVSAARNYGIKRALGEYIAFVDSDDYIIPEIYNKTLIEEKFDLMIFDMECDMGNNKGKYRNVIPEKETGVYEKRVLFDAIVKKSGAGAPFAKLFRTGMLVSNEIEFDTEIQNGEDRDFIIQVVVIIDAFIYIKKSIYKYDYSVSTGRKRIIENAEGAIYSIKKGYYKENKAINELDMSDALRENYRKQLSQRIIKSLMCTTGQIVINKIISSKLEEQIINVLHQIDKNTFIDNRMAMLRYMLLDGQHWKLIALYEKARMLWASFKFKHLKKW